MTEQEELLAQIREAWAPVVDALTNLAAAYVEWGKQSGILDEDGLTEFAKDLLERGTREMT